MWVLSHCQLWKRLALFTFLPPTWRKGPELRRPGFQSCPYPSLGAAPGTHRAFLALSGLLAIFQLFLAVEAFPFPNEILHANSIFKIAEWGCLDKRRSLPALFPFDPASPRRSTGTSEDPARTGSSTPPFRLLLAVTFYDLTLICTI